METKVARDPILFAEKVGQHLTKCIDYHLIKKVTIPISRTIRSHCLDKVKMVQSSPINTFIHLLVAESQITKHHVARMIVFLHEFGYKHLNDMF